MIDFLVFLFINDNFAHYNLKIYYFFMDKQTANSLVANTGLHFKTVMLDLNPEEPLVLPNGKTLKYTFLETIDFLEDARIRVDVCTFKDNEYIPVNDLKEKRLLEEAPNGMLELDDCGVPKMKNNEALATVEHYPQGDHNLMSVNSFSSLRIKHDQDVKTGFELLLGKWLPMPMFEVDIAGQSAGYPYGWCRVRIDAIGERRDDGVQRYRFCWAFDTRLADDLAGGIIRPSFLDGSAEQKAYSLCNRADLLLGSFLNIPDGQNDAPVGDYIASLLGVDLKQDQPQKYKFLAYYVYLINYLRLSGAAPEVVLYNKTDKEIPVDMSVDIGNSRTCAVLFENGNFTKARMLRLRDLTEPWRTYKNAFDMRVVFRKADFGGDLTMDKSLFQWYSLVRVGDEARHLVYRTIESNGQSARSTNYSSPKRYLWDELPYVSRWEQMVAEDDPTNVKINPQIFIDGCTDYFDNDGTYLDTPKELDLFSLGTDDKQCHYSRRSLMTFVMIEMLQHAQTYINSCEFRDMHGSIDCRRYLRNIIVTCPTAMPLEEQRVLRNAAKNAANLLHKLTPTVPEVTVTPDPDKLHTTDDIEEQQKRGWLYDEAFASQLVYLYAELAQRYGGHIDKFIKMKGHYRKDLEKRGLDGNAVTIGTIDIGAGTTDIMVTAYSKKGDGRLIPTPLFYDSFYSAGDDILHNIIRDVILEGADNEHDSLGSIGSALKARMLKMTPEELLAIPRVAETKQYRDTVESIQMAFPEEEARQLRLHITHELMHHFFADNSANQSEKDRRNRLEFCTQISIPMSQFFMEQLKLKRPRKLYTYNEIFPKEQPAGFLLDAFAYHFGFRFEDLKWQYDPTEIGNIVRDTMEPLTKVLSVVMYAHHCDILVLSGRPTNLEPITELFLKYIPIAPNRLVLLNQYHVGRWFPLATEEGYFQENQKAVVAVGAEVGYLASTVGFNGLVLDFSSLGKDMKSTARFIGIYDEDLQEVPTPVLTPDNNTATLNGISVFPCYLGCKQFDSPKYQARPLYAIYNNSPHPQLNIMLQRNYYEDREVLTIEDVTDMEGDSVPQNDVDLHLQTLANDGNFWMDLGAFILKIQEN